MHLQTSIDATEMTQAQQTSTPIWQTLVILSTLFIIAGCSAFGSRPDPERLMPLAKNSIYKNERFHNASNQQVYTKSFWKVLRKFMFAATGEREPKHPLPVRMLDDKTWTHTPSQDLKLIWLGHASAYLEIEGKRLLIDPVLSERTSPYQWMGPARFFPAPVKAEDLPELDAVLITHDHYDHLDYDTIVKLQHKTRRFHVPLGVDAHLRGWGIAEEKIVAHDWWQESPISETLSVIAAPAQHFSGRGMFDRNMTLWASWIIKGQQRRVYHSGDTGMFKEFKEIGTRFGPFDLTLLHIGAYAEEWYPIHMTPEDAVKAHLQLNGNQLVPIHWATFNLAFHPWYEPGERFITAAKAAGINYQTPEPGQTLDFQEVISSKPWWRVAMQQKTTAP